MQPREDSAVSDETFADLRKLENVNSLSWTMSIEMLWNVPKFTLNFKTVCLSISNTCTVHDTVAIHLYPYSRVVRSRATSQEEEGWLADRTQEVEVHTHERIGCWAAVGRRSLSSFGVSWGRQKRTCVDGIWYLLGGSLLRQVIHDGMWIFGDHVFLLGR